MKNFDKYQINYFMPPEITYDWVKKDHIDKPPIWCSVDLRDGNQALIEPMSLEEKLEFFKLLVAVGFKDIEVGFPAASETEYKFLRTLIENDMIPNDVTIQVLTQAREHIIKKTFKALEGAKNAVVHLYNSTSVAQREQVFRKSREEVKQIAVDGAVLLKELAREANADYTFQYSPESFPGTEVDYALEVCNAVIDIWKPTPEKKAIINIPATVENAMPHVFACQVEYMSKNLKDRDSIVLCLHPHNDRECGVSDAEMGILAGADRIEGTLFGNGERTGNVDIITLALNMYSQGVDPGLDFGNMPQICAEYEKLTRMHVYERQPYAGALVFTAFSGSHQDAIAKGMNFRENTNCKIWTVPYLPIDPNDVGRKYESDVIRINSQSGKGGVSYILKQSHGISIPEKMKEELGYLVKDVSDKEHKELSPQWVYSIFSNEYVNNFTVFNVTDCHFKQKGEIISAEIVININEQSHYVEADGNGRLDAVSNAVKTHFGLDYELSVYEEHALSKGTASKAVSYVGILADGKMSWGVGIDEDIIRSSVDALISAINRLPQIKKNYSDSGDERLNEILSFIRTNYTTVTLEELSGKFYLSKPYLSKYIKNKAGNSFGEILKNIRMNKAQSLLKNTNMPVENISESVGYQNVEHFNRLFKRLYGITPLAFRNNKK